MTNENDFETIASRLKTKIAENIENGEQVLLKRNIEALEKLLKIAPQSDKTKMISNMQERRKARDELMAELERRFEKMNTSNKIKKNEI